MRTSMTFPEFWRMFPTFTRVPVEVPSLCGWPSERAQNSLTFFSRPKTHIVGVNLKGGSEDFHRKWKENRRK